MTEDPTPSTAEPPAILVADVGGTNARLALARGDAVRAETLARFPGDDHADFPAVLAAYAATRRLPPLAGVAIAIAGPVSPLGARLTNRDWSFDPTALSARLPGRPPVHLLNDLAALGHALPALRPDQWRALREGRGGAGNGQSLVVGIGTGFNVCLTKAQAGGEPAVIEAEVGHAGLPAGLRDALRDALGQGADRFVTVEDLFSGPGFAALRDRMGSDAEARALMARLLGLYARDLALHCMPREGMFFAGGAARGILEGEALPGFLAAAEAPGRFAEHIAPIPLRLITDDMAALTGAARVAALRAQ